MASVIQESACFLLLVIHYNFSGAVDGSFSLFFLFVILVLLLLFRVSLSFVLFRFLFSSISLLLFLFRGVVRGTKATNHAMQARIWKSQHTAPGPGTRHEASCGRPCPKSCARPAPAAGRGGKPDIDFKSLAALNHTLVFYMGLKSFPTISAELIRHGTNPALPVAAIYKGTSKDQEVVIGTLKDLPKKTENMRSPVLLIVGEVVSLADNLSWFKSQALLAESAEKLKQNEKTYEKV